jgi:hypothetical protein
MKGVFMSRHSLRLQFTIWAVLTVGAGWAFMFAVGVVHHEWITSCPTIGFWWAILLRSLLRITPSAGTRLSATVLRLTRTRS